MRCEVVAVGSELLLGQIVDTNSSWIGEQLALAGIDSFFQTKVGDNFERMHAVISQAIDRNDAVIITGGLGPTQDDITREVIAAVKGVELERRQDLVEKIEAMFGTRGRSMPANNRRQADVPVGGDAIPIQPGTAPGLVVPVGDTIVYAVPGVPWEMKQMMSGFILPDLKERAGITSIIKSRTLRTWGASESGLAQMLDDEIARVDTEGGATIAFLASGIEGLKVRLTAKADVETDVDAMLAEGDERVRAIIGDRLVFGIDDETMEAAVLSLCRDQGLTLGVAESLTGGLIGARITAVPGASDVFQGAIVSYASSVKSSVLGVEAQADVSDEAVRDMAAGACAVLGADVSVAVTGVAGPAPLEGHEPGTVFMATSVDGVVESSLVTWPFDRDRTRQFTTINVLNQLRLRLIARAEQSSQA